MEGIEAIVRGVESRGGRWGVFPRRERVVWIGSHDKPLCASLSAVSQINLSQDFDAAAERVYDALADQDGMSAWMGSKISVPVRGADGLVGTVRRIHVGPTSFDERIVEAQRPTLLAYTICSPMPLLVKHRGELRVVPIDARRSRVTWDIELEMKSALVAAAIKPVLTLALGAALKRLAAKLR